MIIRRARRLNQKPYDVIVVGGGTAGVVAAVQAARAGALTLLVEKTGMLGGTMTNGGVNYPGLFHAWGRQVIAGIGWELVTRAVEETGGMLPDFTVYDRQRHSLLQVSVNAFAYAALCDETALQAGVDILFHSMPATVTKSDGGSWVLTLCTKSGLKAYGAKVLVDTTGDANLVALAGFALNVPEETQPASLSCRAGGYDPADLDDDAINHAYNKAVESGELKTTDVCWNTKRANVSRWLRTRGANASHIHNLRAESSEGKRLAELEARRSLLRLLRFLRTQPGLEHLVIESVCPECGIRETVTIKGQYIVTRDDYRAGRLWDDSLCYAFYPIDLHRSDGKGLGKEPLEVGVVPTVPRRALLPEGSENFVVAGRCVSSDRLANSALRVQASCMAMGQAAGAMAALAALSGVTPARLSIDEVKALLVKHGAIVPEGKHDVDE